MVVVEEAVAAGNGISTAWLMALSMGDVLTGIFVMSHSA